MEPIRIGQVAKRAGVSVDAVRFYEREGLLRKPGRTGGGYREFAEDAVSRVRFVLRAKDLGFTLREIKGLLALHDDPSATRADVREQADSKLTTVEQELLTLHERHAALSRLRAGCEGAGPARDCPILRAIVGPGEAGGLPPVGGSRTNGGA